MSLIHEITDRVMDVSHQAVSDCEMQSARDCLMDTVACGIAGSSRQAAQRLRNSFDGLGGAQSVVGSDRRLSADDAILANAAAFRILDFNDVYAGRNNLHPSETVIPLVLERAEAEDWSGEEVLQFIARGYQIHIGIGDIWEGLLGGGWAPTATLGQIASAAFAGILRQGDRDSISNGIAIASVTAPALGVVFRGEMSDAKNLVNGLAAVAGLRAFRMAQGGVTGPRDALEGPAGFNTQIGGSATIAVDAPFDKGPSVAWIKAYPTVFHIHSAIEAAIDAHSVFDDVLKIEALDIRVSERATAVAANRDRFFPSSPEAAQFSLPYCVAYALSHGECTLEAFTTEALKDSQVNQLLSRTTVHSDARWTGYRGGTVEVTIGGDHRSFSVDAPSGHPENPMGSNGVLKKAERLMRPYVGEGAAAHIIARCLTLGSESSVSSLMDAFRTITEESEE